MRVLINEPEEYIKVTNAGIICPDCGKRKGSVEYIKIFKVKTYLPPEDEGWQFREQLEGFKDLVQPI